MKLFTILVTVYLTLFTHSLFSQASWTQRADMAGGERYGATGFEINNIGYVCAGADYSTSYDLWAYDPVINAWTEKAPVPTTNGGFNSCSFSIDSMGYFLLGRNDFGNSSKEVWQYDPVADVWTERSEFPGTARAGAAAFVIQDHGYIMSGYDEITDEFSDVWQYEPVTDTWIEKNNFPGAPRHFSFTFVIGSYAYLGGGYSYIDFDPERYEDFWRYDPQTDTWDSIGVLPTGKLSNAFGFTLDKRGYFVNGTFNIDDYSAEIWEYDPAANLWTAYPDYPDTAKTHGVGFVLNDDAYITTGRIVIPESTTHTWKFDNGIESDTTVIDTTGNDTTLTLGSVLIDDACMIYPNPSDGLFHLKFNAPVEEAELLIFNLAGEQVYSQRLDHDQNTTINLQHLSGGLYLAAIKNDQFYAMKCITIN